MTAAWRDGTKVTILEPNEDAGREGETCGWMYAFASESRRYWVELEDLSRKVVVHESELRREEPS